MKSKWASWVVCVAAAAVGLKRNWRQFVLRRVAVKTMSKNPGIFQFKLSEKKSSEAILIATCL